MSKRIVIRSAKSAAILLEKKVNEPKVEEPKEENPVVEAKEEAPLKSKADTQCMSRITYDHHAQYFGNQRNKFYLEFRCPFPRFREMDVCVRCLVKNETASQDSRRFDHGKINEPIPDASHLFGGRWYQEGVVKWGEPASHRILFAQTHQEEARGSYVVQQPIYHIVSSKVKKPSSSQEDMPKKQSVNTATTETTTEAITEAIEKPKRKPRAKKVTEEEKKVTEEEKKEEKKPRAVRKKRSTEPSPYQALASDQRLIYKEVTLPTHQEQSMEEVDLDDYTVVYVELKPFEWEGALYYRDEKKQKLYRRIRDKHVGNYVGRYDPQTQTLHEDIPDSDDETE
jgi:hypothetical protein